MAVIDSVTVISWVVVLYIEYDYDSDDVYWIQNPEGLVYPTPLIVHVG